MPLRAPCRIGVIIFLPCSMRYTTHTHTHRSCSKTARDEKTSFDSGTNPLSETPFSFLRPNHINQYNHPHMHSHTRPSAHPSIHPSIGVSVADLSTTHRTLCPASTIKHTTTYYRTIQNETEQQHERKRDTNILRFANHLSFFLHETRSSTFESQCCGSFFIFFTPHTVVNVPAQT